MTRSIWPPILVAALAALAVAILGGTVTDIGPWYQSLRKPDWQPPGWLFGPVWSVIFALAAASGVTAWRAAPNRPTREWLLALFALNGFLNVLWSLLFFRLRRPDLALIEVAFLWLSILALMIYLGRFSGRASLLLAPYLAWVGFASVLNYVIVGLNAPFVKSASAWLAARGIIPG